MSGSVREPRPTRADYVWWERASTRWNDNDVFGHMNNAVYFELMDTAVNNQLVEAVGGPVEELDAIGVVAEVSCRYFREMRYPGHVDIGIAAERVGTSSITYRVGLFQGGPPSVEQHEQASAEGRFVHVYVANTAGERGVVPLPERIRASAEALLKPPVTG